MNKVKMMAEQKAEQMTERQKRLYEMTQQLDDNGCWIWQGQVSNSGYGRLKIKDEHNQVKMMSAQSVSYQYFIEDVPEGHLVKQDCGNRLCINPQHLSLMKI
jgi:hypothetical protein